MIKLNLNNNLAAQDMIRIVMKEKGLSAKEAIDFSVNREMYQKIIQEGYAAIALDLWGHDDPEREWNVLDDPIIELEFDKLKRQLIDEIAEKEKTDIETAVSYYLIFTMDSSGYHI